MQPSNGKPLGQVIAVYRDRPLTRRDLLLFFLPLALAVLTPWAYGVFRTYYAQANYGPVAARTWGSPWFGLAALALIPLLLLALIRIRRSRRIVIVHKKGLRIRDTFGRDRTLFWEQVEALSCNSVQESFLGIHLVPRHRVRVFPVDGKPIRLNRNLDQLPELTARIKAKIHPRKLAEFRSDLKTGKILSFGAVRLDQKRLGLKGKDYPWDQVALVNVQAGHLVIEFSNTRALKIPIGQIPNVELMIQLIREGVEV
jgi:hypothetical protein